MSVSANGRLAALARRIGLEAIRTRPGPAWMVARGWCEIEWRVTRGRWEETVRGAPAGPR